MVVVAAALPIHPNQAGPHVACAQRPVRCVRHDGAAAAQAAGRLLPQPVMTCRNPRMMVFEDRA
jgi:hypothetical protein